MMLLLPLQTVVAKAASCPHVGSVTLSEADFTPFSLPSPHPRAEYSSVELLGPRFHIEGRQFARHDFQVTALKA